MKFTIAALCLIISATLASAQVRTPDALTDSQIASLIERIKQMPVSRLDAALPRRVSFAQWLQDQAGPGAKIGWVIRTADPTDAGRNFPTCVEADAVLESGRAIVIFIGVGTPGKVRDRKPFVYEAELTKPNQAIKNLPRLSDLPAALSKVQDTENHLEAVK
jgi:hypothetical protein